MMVRDGGEVPRRWEPQLQQVQPLVHLLALLLRARLLRARLVLPLLPALLAHLRLRVQVPQVLLVLQLRRRSLIRQRLQVQVVRARPVALVLAVQVQVLAQAQRRQPVVVHRVLARRQQVRLSGKINLWITM